MTISIEIGDLREQGRTFSSMARLYSDLGNTESAIDNYRNAIDIARQIPDKPGEGSALLGLGNIYFTLGDVEIASSYWQESLRIARATGDGELEVLLLNALGRAESDSLIASARENDSARLEAYGWLSKGIDYQNSGNYDAALEAYQRSLAIYKSIGSRDREGLVLALIGQIWAIKEHRELAIIFLKKSVNVREVIRVGIQSLSLTLDQSYTNTIADTYRYLADLLLQQDRILEAQRVLDLLKVQELDTYVRGVRSNSNTQAGIELVLPEAQIARAYDALVDQAIANGKRLGELEAKPSLSAAETAEMLALQGERRELLQAFNQFRFSDLVQRELARLSPAERDRNLQLGQLAALQDNLSQIPQGAVLLYPLILEDRLELVVTSPYAPPLHRSVAVTPAQLAAAVQAFRYALETPTRDALTPAQQLYDWLIAPIEADLQAAGVNTLIYAPDRILRYIPLAALHDGEQWLAERYRVNNITAASLTDLNTQPNPQPRILAGALTEGPVTVEAGGRRYDFQALRHAEAEVNGIAALDPRVNPLLGASFSPAEVEREANRHTIVHLATHAKFLVGQPEDSFILFSNRDRWTLADFNAGLLNLTRVDLVVLSACETGVDNTFGNGEEILGFGYLMQYAGARAAMASLWAVDDGGTQVLMGEFYDALLRGRLGKAEALRQAQLALIHLGREESRGGFELAEDLGLDPNTLAHPHYWAPFILIGNGL